MLLEDVLPFLPPNGGYILLRHLPVDAGRAEREIRRAILRHKPNLIVCCGMGRSRKYLKIERQARIGNKLLRSRLPSPALARGLPTVRISRYAGAFVCNETYFRLLKFCQRHQPRAACLFVHVPKTSARFWPQVVRDFALLLQRLSACLVEPSSSI